MKRALLAGACTALLLSPDAAAQEPATSPLPLAAAHDNRTSAGQLKDRRLTLRLEIATARWQPEGETGPTRTVQVFVEEGRAPQVPGPLIRVPEGTEIHVAVRNRLADVARLHGMMTRPGDPGASAEIAPGAVREFRFNAGQAGTYFYWARTTSPSYFERRLIDSQLSGAFIVDPERAEDRVDDRVFVISEWLDEFAAPPRKFSATINGASWPRTERLTLPFGLAAHWRVINASFGAHPMHLHGTFYTVESRGDAGHDTSYGADRRRLVTTELMEPGTTMAMRWVPDRVGNWLFHCHILAHVTGEMRSGDLTPEQRQAAAHHEEHDIEKAMAGLVMGITVPSGDETSAADLEPHIPRRLRLTMTQEPNRYGANPGFGFRIDEVAVPGLEAPRDSGAGERNPSPTLVLTQGQPVVITLVSQLEKDTQIHWHGIELESYNDGVPGWSGNLRQITPSIAPGASYDVRYTPPRAGTFIYHTHAHDRSQLGSGLYGALVVVEPGQPFNPAVERMVLMGGAGPESPAVEVNRSTNPLPMDVKVGVAHRFRLINISPNFTAIVSLRDNSGTVQWKPVSKDGAELPPAQMAAKPARQVISVGETYDFEYTPTAPGELRLEVFKRGLQPVITTVLVRAIR